MSDDLKGRIETFIGHFETQIAEIKALQTERQELYRKVLYVSILDALARSVLPKRESNRERFIYFLKRFCRWRDGDRVSLSHLVELLRRNPDPVFEKLRGWALTEHKKQSVHGGALMPISDDPTFDAVKSFWPSAQEHRTPIEGIDLTALQHFRLLYAYRNMLVHEMRTPGRGMEFGTDSEEPYYHGMSTVGKGGKLSGKSVELVYPWLFLHRLCDTALSELRGYFNANELNPYDSFVFGTYWIEELNT